MPGRITYNNINVDFGHDFNVYEEIENQNQSRSISHAGIEQVAHFYSQSFVTARSRLVTSQTKEELDQFFDYAKDGSTFMFERDSDLGTYINFEGGDHTTVGDSLKTNDGVAGTFTRTGSVDSAYYVDPSTGLLTNKGGATSNVPRFPAGKYGRGLVIEGARTNLITQPSDLSAIWVNSGANTLSINTTETKDALGTNIADKVTWAAAPAFFRFTTSTAISTNDAVFTCLAKTPSGSNTVTLRILDSTGTTLASSNTVVTPSGSDDFGNGFQRLEVSYDNPGTNANNWRVEISGTEAEDVYLMAFVLEVGANVLFPSSTIGAISTASITRNADKLLYSDANAISRQKGTVSMWWKPEFSPSSHPAAILFQSGVSVSQGHIRMGYANTTANFFIDAYTNNSTTTIQSFVASGGLISQDTWHHIVFTWDSTISNGLNLFVDGTLRKTSTNSAFNISDTGTNIAIGSQIDGTNVAYSVFDDILIMKKVLTATEISAVFNRGRGLGYGRNRYTSMILESYKTSERRGGRFDIELRMKEELT